MLTIIPLGSSSEVATWWQAGDPSRLMIKCYGLYPLFTWRCFVILVPQIWGFDCATKPPKNEQFRNAKNSYKNCHLWLSKAETFPIIFCFCPEDCCHTQCWGIPNFTMRYSDGAFADMVAVRDIHVPWLFFVERGGADGLVLWNGNGKTDRR